VLVSLRYMKKGLFIINPKSGKLNFKEAEKRLQSLCNEYSHQSQVVVWEKKDGLDELIERGKAENVDVIFGVGGDGTIHEIAKRLIGTETALGIIPTGSGNGIGRHFKIPLQFKKAFDLINTGEIRLIDTGLCDGKPFIGFMGTGIDATVAHQFSSLTKRGFLPYVKLAFSEYSKRETEICEIELDGKKKFKVDAQIMAVGNTSQFGNGAIFSPQSNAMDGMLEFASLALVPHWYLPLMIIRIFTGWYGGFSLYQNHSFKEARIRRTRAVKTTQLDGEPIISDEWMSVSVVPKSLRILLPK